MTLGVTIQESKDNRKDHVLDALYFRRKRLRKAKQASLGLAKLERMNQQFFLGEQPF